MIPSATTRALLPLLAAAVALLARPAGAATQQRAPAPATRAGAGAPTAAPRLVVFITVDQFRESYLESYGPQLTGGLGRLLRGGAFFTQAYHDHAVTETAPGHSTLLSGRFPRGTGIVSNSRGVTDAQTPLVPPARGSGASPFRFRGSTLIDWLRSADPGSRALSVSRKDRGAILPLGRAHQQAYWYAAPGVFTTSTYYADTLPTWVQAFNARREPLAYAGKSWTLLLPESSYAEPDSVPAESQGRDFTFPHALPADSSVAGALGDTPFMDQVTLDLALEGLNALALGAGDHTDLLAVSLSTTDAIGHRYGPESREIHDQVLRLDRMLGTFIDSIYRLRDSTRVVFALTADHGVTPLPELHTRNAEEARARKLDPRPMMREILAKLARRGVPAGAFTFSSFMVSVDRPAFAAAHVDADSVLRAFVAGARAMTGVARVDRVDRLARADTVHDAIARRWLHMLPPDAGVELVLTLRPGYVGAGAGAQHGGPYEPDTHVPILLYGPPFRPGRYQQRVRVVDVAPTLARVAGVTPTEPLDGRVLVQALRPAATNPAAVTAARP